MFFKTKPACFGKHSETWAVCQECNFKRMCVSEKLILSSGPTPRSRKEVIGISVSEAMGDKDYFDKHDYNSQKAIQEGLDFNRRQLEITDVEDGPSEPRVRTHAPVQKPRRKPRTRLCKGIIEDPNMAIMFGIGKYAEVIGWLKPEELIAEFKRIYRNDDGDIRDRRLEIIKNAVESGPPKMWKRFSEVYTTA